MRMREKWLETGHYGITSAAVDATGDDELRALLRRNLPRISYHFTEIAQPDFESDIAARSAAGEFIPLADVPDVIWKYPPPALDSAFGRVGGRATHWSSDHGSGPETPNHYADIDIAVNGHATWREQCLQNDALIDPDVWCRDFYLKWPKPEAVARMGVLPFRVWQLFDAMVECLGDNDVVGFLAYAGVCAHYIGDACQPLHGSVLSNGDGSRTARRWSEEKQHFVEVPHGIGVHLAYEGDMISQHVQAIIGGISNPPRNDRASYFSDGRGAARAVLQLMDDVVVILPPLEIVDRFETAWSAYDHGGAEAVPPSDLQSAIISAMWRDLGDRTIDAMVLGCSALALVWDSAWAAGGGPDLPSHAIPKEIIATDVLRELYISPEFAQSKEIGQIGGCLRR
jgi:hypothetical protein